MEISISGNHVMRGIGVLSIKETLMQLQKLFGLIVLLLVADQEFQRLLFCITTSKNYLGENCHAKPSEAISAF